MAGAGAEICLDLTAHAVVGLWEVIRNYGKFRKFFRRLLNLAMARQPEAIILIDYPGFNLRFASAIRRTIIERAGPFHNWRPKMIYYVSPQFWAWHESRVKKMAADIDLLLSIFPFEPAWYRARVPGLAVEFVGHPVIDRYSPAAIRAALAPSIQEDKTPPLILLLPGSRRRELEAHLPVLAESVRVLRGQRRLRMRCIVPTDALAILAESAFQGLDVDLRASGLAEALAEATIAIAASGTVTVECARFGVPTVVIYRTSWSTYLLGRRLIRVKFLAMPNLLAGRELFPELIQKDVTSANIAQLALRLLDQPAERAEIQRGLAEVVQALGPPGASRRAAKAVLDLFAREKVV